MRAGIWFKAGKKESGKSATHALVIGTSKYPHLLPKDVWNEDARAALLDLGLEQLTSTATGAYRFAEWLKAQGKYLDGPLASIRLLLSPTQAEAKGLGIEAELGTKKPIRPACFSQVRRAFRSWYADCNESRHNVALLYVAGHGLVDANRITYVALEDFAKESTFLDGAIDFRNIFDELEKMQARRQYILIDACQVKAIHASDYDRWKMGGKVILDTKKQHPDRKLYRCKIYSTWRGDLAYETRDGTGTVFSRALLDCLKTVAVVWEPPHGWCVTLKSLNDRLPKRVNYVASSEGVKQFPLIDASEAPHPEGTVLVKINEPPIVPFTLQVAPVGVVPQLSAHFREPRRGEEILAGPLPSHPYINDIKPGHYILGFSSNGAAGSVAFGKPNPPCSLDLDGAFAYPKCEHMFELIADKPHCALCGFAPKP
jgi:hypothetical protein